MARPWEFQLPTRVVFGRGALRRLGDVVRPFGSSALVVGYREAPALEEAYARAARFLEKSGIATRWFRRIDADPDADLPAEGALQAREIGADVVVALGGGSVIDAAKAIAALARTEGRLWDYTDANPQSRPLAEALPLVAVPTTAGTGSEVSSVAVLTYHGVGPRPEWPLKAAVYGPAIVPRVALVDPDLAAGSPPLLTAACGADALGHAIESITSRRANPIASTLAAQAVRLIVAHLPRAAADPADPGPREPLALAATLAGVAFNQSGVTVSHAIAEALGALLEIPHGLAVAIATPLCLRYNAEPCVAQYAELADALGLSAALPEEKAAGFVDAITGLLYSVGLPDHAAIPPDAPDDLADRLVENAIAGSSAAITLNPRKTDAAALKRLFQQALKARDKAPGKAGWTAQRCQPD